MATVRPFKGFRPPPKLAGEVAAKPYDVLSSEEARVEAKGKPLSFLHVGKPEIDLPEGTNLYDPIVYETASKNLLKLMADGALKEDPKACYYLYQQTMGSHVQAGILGCASVEEYWNDTIKKHELTRKDKEDDRTMHVKVTNAHSGPIFLTYHAEPRIDAIADRVRLVEAPVNFVADDGIRHQLWVISDDRLIRSLVDLFSRVERLYVADGHHRSAAAARVGREMAKANPNHKGDEEYNFFLAVLFPHNQLRIMEYNRVVKDLNGYDETSFLAMVRKQGFNVKKSEKPVQPKRKGEFGMYVRGAWYTLMADLKFLNNLDLVQRLDVSILQNHLLAPLLAIDDPRTNKRIDFVGGIRGIPELVKRVDSGEMAVAFSLYPTSIGELISIADAGKIMPPKSTWFEPKLRDGVVVHFLS
jgi:uncharacterized protein (DUF1015 family)